ncbi:MAG: endopeptidase La [Acidobacteria bacterium]|nr:MAG: endopeptidase La [Acidobacteriota bacterium]
MAAEKREKSEESIKIPKSVPVLPLRDMVVYPFIISPLSIARDSSILAVDAALSENRMVLLLAQKDKDVDQVGEEDLYRVGTVAVIMRMLKLPDNRIRVLVQGVCRAVVEDLTTTRPYLIARISRLPETSAASDSPERQGLVRGVRKALERYSSLGKTIPSEVMVIASNLENPGRLADLTASNLDLKTEEAQQVLEIPEPMARLRRVSELLKREIDLVTMQQEIDTLARDEIDKSQREYYLRQQMKAIQHELGEGNELADEIEQLRRRGSEANMPVHAKDELEKQLKRLERMHPDSAETATLRNYLDILVGLPWSKETKDNLDLRKARAILDEDHYGLEKIKERLLEYLAVRKLKPKMKGPILCFVGPPGVGKTSLGRSIARALGRSFVRVSLGGVRDEAEIRGHRRTYVGAMPGRIIQGIQQGGTSNPVFMLDEVDKLGMDYRGDPSSALLEVLDPEQNNSFRDHYLGIPFDLSGVLFVATANLLDPIHPAFRDRMEVIQLSGYTEEEKIQIAYRHIIAKQIEENGLTPRRINFTPAAVRALIARYTREAGLRNLERNIASVCRKVAREVAEGKKGLSKITAGKLEALLGPPPPTAEESLVMDQIGVATGLAWTATGGDVLFVEATTMPGKGNLILTGHLGEVMKESAQAALSFARSHSGDYGIPDDYFSRTDVHVHLPEGAIPKDGPSAGITMACAMVSAFTGRPVRREIAMTGEITLRGNVLPVGGLKEKILAAHRAKVRMVLLPEANRMSLGDLPSAARRDLRFLFVNHISEVLSAALAERGVLGERPAGRTPQIPGEGGAPSRLPADIPAPVGSS